MLLEFSVANFRSIADRQTLSMVAGTSSKRRKRAVSKTGSALAETALTSAGLFGPNGSGKSTVILALQFYKDFIMTSASKSTEGDEIPVIPFKFKRSLRQKPSEFEAIFVHDGTLFQYGFAADKNRVWDEWLFARPNSSRAKTRELLSRRYSAKQKKYEWRINETFIKGTRETWKSSTRDNALFLSTAVQLNAESLRAPFTWVRNYLQTISAPDRLSPDYSAQRCSEDGKEEVLEFLRSTDLNIVDLKVKEETIALPEDVESLMKESALKKLRNAMEKSKTYSIEAVHSSSEGDKVSLPLEEESAGTQILFSLAGPWLDVIENGYTLFVDELHTSLHPMAFKHLVGIFHDPTLNKKGAQLIFTSHDTSVMGNNFLMRDQIWFLEKTETGATNLFPLSDFDVRESGSFQKSYLGGKFGALPNIRDFEYASEK